MRANLRGASADSVDFTQAVMRDANLSDTLLRESIFFLADLGSVNLSGANLTGAVLRSANLDNTNQAGTLFTGAMMPDNSIHP